MHPSHVPIVNDTFTPNEDELAHARGLVTAMEAAEQERSVAVTYEGLMVDYAMLTTARELLALAGTIEVRSGGRESRPAGAHRDAAVPGGKK